jgi:hypothetical protein
MGIYITCLLACGCSQHTQFCVGASDVLEEVFALASIDSADGRGALKGIVNLADALQ